MRMLTASEIHQALQNRGIEVTIRCDEKPSPRLDQEVYEDIVFSERAWRALLLVATNRRKSSRKLNETQAEIKRRSQFDEPGLRVRVLTVNAALRLQEAGYELEFVGKQYQESIGSKSPR
jgi:hypothetical protein